MESITGWRNNKYAVQLLFGIKKVWVRNAHKFLQCLRKFCGRLKHLSSLGKRMTASKTGKADQKVLPRSGRSVTAVNPEMLQRADSIVR